MKKILIKMIEWYQKSFSPDHGAMKGAVGLGCRFYPSCSVYAKKAIEKYGGLRGGGKALWRILRCGPWSKGGIDLLD